MAATKKTDQKPTVDAPAADPFELVRVRDNTTRQERTVRRFVALGDEKRYELHADKPAADADGRPLPAKPYTTTPDPAAAPATEPTA